jgi:SAM-dependent methyltransferase
VDYLKDTISTYRKSAKELSGYFQSIPSRSDDVAIAFKLVGEKPNAKVVEIGCGDGRDAAEIIRRTNDYTGFDVSRELITIAQKEVPEAKFLVADVRNFEYPANTDIVFAFASLIHVKMDDLKKTFGKIHMSLSKEGILYISLKYAEKYSEYTKDDRFGKRLYYLYNPQIIRELSAGKFKIEKESSDFVTDKPWFEMALRKI